MTTSAPLYSISATLNEYSGALVVISHDRHLLRSVCDELLIVHDGIVDRFKQSLDEYPAWLKERELSSGQQEDQTSSDQPPVKQLSKKQQRQEQAQRRQRLKPLTDKVRDAESQLVKARSDLELLGEQLADETLYSDADRQSELTQLVREQTELNKTIEELEWQWLEASEALDLEKS